MTSSQGEGLIICFFVTCISHKIHALEISLYCSASYVCVKVAVECAKESTYFST